MGMHEIVAERAEMKQTHRRVIPMSSELPVMDVGRGARAARQPQLTETSAAVVYDPTRLRQLIRLCGHRLL